MPDFYQKTERPPLPPPPLPPPLLPGVYSEAIAVGQEEKTMAMLCHLLSIFTGFLGPLILWLVKKDASPFVDHHGRESLNFQITLFIAMLVLGGATFALLFIMIGLVLVPFLFLIPLLGLIAQIVACAAAANGKWYRYPCSIRIL